MFYVLSALKLYTIFTKIRQHVKYKCFIKKNSELRTSKIFELMKKQFVKYFVFNLQDLIPGRKMQST